MEAQSQTRIGVITAEMKVTRILLLTIVGFMMLACEEEKLDTNSLEGIWQLQIEMFDNSTKIGCLSGIVEFRNDHSALFIDNLTQEESMYYWSLELEILQLINNSTDFAVLYSVDSESKDHIQLNQGEDVKMSLFR